MKANKWLFNKEILFYKANVKNKNTLITSKTLEFKQFVKKMGDTNINFVFAVCFLKRSKPQTSDLD